MLKYRALVLDHDDTAVKSTEQIHYPSFVNTLYLFRPGKFFTLEEFLSYSYSPGIHSLYRDILGFTKEELELEYDMWQKFAAEHVPPFYEGIKEIIEEQRERGGLVFTVTHSSEKIVLRDFEAAGIMPPDKIYGYELGEKYSKPHPFPLLDIMEKYSLSPSDMLVVDDLKPGLTMARAAGVRFAAALWGHNVPEIRRAMKENADEYYYGTYELYRSLFGE